MHYHLFSSLYIIRAISDAQSRTSMVATSSPMRGQDEGREAVSKFSNAWKGSMQASRGQEHRTPDPGGDLVDQAREHATRALCGAARCHGETSRSGLVGLAQARVAGQAGPSTAYLFNSASAATVAAPRSEDRAIRLVPKLWGHHT